VRHMEPGITQTQSASTPKQNGNGRTLEHIVAIGHSDVSHLKTFIFHNTCRLQGTPEEKEPHADILSLQ
jgi:hypothetical protein